MRRTSLSSTSHHNIVRQLQAVLEIVVMPDVDLIDHSPHQPEPAPPLKTASNLVLIDNYDSFTWNVYQYLVLEGAKVTVFRNDEISIAELIKINPTQLVVSPGPGHPESDSGISKDAIRQFGGKIPILGVCMGQYASSGSSFPLPTDNTQAMHVLCIRRSCRTDWRNSAW